MTFRELGLSAPILTALEEQGYTIPSAIQEKAIPPALLGRDILGCAQTGTGKTCAFATPILQRLDVAVPGRPVRALILTPTRELAIQIGESFDAYGSHLPLRTSVIFGGVSQGPQVEKLRRGVDILVATPGRLGDLYQQKLLDLSRLEIFVLDEADRMLDMGFINDVKRILTWLPKKKQTLFFSATMPPEITNLVNSLLTDPVRVEVTPASSPVEAINQTLYFVDKNNKPKLLAQLVHTMKIPQALIFTRTKHGANKVAHALLKADITAAAIHGNKSQTARQQALADFKSGAVRCLVATDIAARGIDIEDLSHVFNFNLPEVPETYVHRIGRTGRAGREGSAIAFCDFSEKALLKDVEKLMGRKIQVVDNHNFPMVDLSLPKKDQFGRVVNAEDAEAKAAAKERRRLHGSSPHSSAGAKRQAPAPRTAVVRDVAKVSSNDSRPRRSAENAAAPQRDQPRKKMTRSGTLMETGSAMPQADVSRPSALAGDRIMDATARLLAPRKATYGQPQRSGDNKNTQRSSDSRKPQRTGDNRQSGMTQSGNTQGSQRTKSAGGPASSSQPYKGGQSQRSGDNQGRSRQNGHHNNGRNRGPMPPMERPRSANHTKDSTEQSTLMKPFYLDFK